MADLPAGITYLTVSGKLTKAVADTADAGVNPDSVALSGQVTFKPEIGKRGYSGELLSGGRITLATAVPPLIVVVDPVPVALAADGSFSVTLVDPKNPLIAPADWSWTVDFSSVVGAKIQSFAFNSPAASQVLDLASVVPVEISTGGAVFINEAAASAASAAASAASAAQSAALVGAPADSAMAAVVGNSASATRTQLNSTFARRFWADVTSPEYGAIGDGVANDTAAIQAAIDAAFAAGGGTVFFPRGTFAATRLTLKSRVALLGSNWMASTLKHRTGTNADFIVLADVNTEQVSIRDLRVNGNRAGNSSGDTIVIDNTAGVYGFSDPYHSFQNVFVENSAGDAWQITQGCREVRFFNCHAKLSYGHGFNITGTDNFFTDCTAATSGLAGWYVAGGNNQFISCKSFSSGERMTGTGDVADGFYITYAPRCKFIGCEAQDNRRYGFVLVGNLCFSNMLVGCLADSNAIFAGSTFSGFMIDNLAQRNHLTGCVSGNQRTTQDYGLIVQGGAFANEIDLKIDSQGVAEHFYVGTAVADNNIRINGIGAENTADAITTGQEVFSRRLINSASISSGATGRLLLTYFTARKTASVTALRMMSAGTASGTPTLVRVGIYSVASNGDLALVGSTANDVALFAGTFATYTPPLSVATPLAAGGRYALGLLVVASILPFIYGQSVSFGSEAAVAPRMGGTLSSLADLPATALAGTITATNAHLLPYAALT